MTMGERIKQLRKENGMTQTDLAMKLNVTKGTISTWETNSRTPGFETLDAMCDLFQRRLDYIMGRSDDATPTTQADEAASDLALAQVEEDLTEYALKYARLDQYGREAVEAIIRVEYNRCKNEDALCPASAYTGYIAISQESSAE